MEQQKEKQVQQTQQETQITHVSPQLIKVMADNESNKRVLCHWISFFLLVIGIYLLTFAVPSPFVELTPEYPIKDAKTGECPLLYQDGEHILSSTCDQMTALNPVLGLQIFNMNATNQFLIVQMNFTKNADLHGKQKQKVQYKYDQYSISENMNIEKTIIRNEKHHFTVECNEDLDSKLECESRWVMYIPEIKYDHYFFRIEFLNYEDFQAVTQLSGVSFIYINSDYTNFLFGIKYVFLVISVIAFLIYFFRLRQLEQTHWVIEQKFILALSATLIFFNDPIYAITILNPNMASAFFSVMFMVNFLIILFIFWIVALKRVVEDNAQKNTKTFNKKLMAFGVSMWLFLLITYVGFSYEYQQHPGTEMYDEFNVGYEIFKWLGIILMSIFLLYIIYNYFQIGRVYKTRIWRHRLFTVFSIYFIFCIAIFMFTGTPHVYNSYGGRVLLFICMMNMYIYYLQFMYTPSEAGLQEAQQNKQLDNPQQNNQVYEMLDESIQIQDQQQIEYDEKRHQQQTYKIDDEDDDQDLGGDDNNQQNQQKQKMDDIYQNV